MIPLDEAQRFVFGLCHPLPPVELPLDDALGCVLSATVVATQQVPSFANSSMDGYAVRADDTSGAPIRLAVIGTIMAGHPFEQTVGPGQAARIMTGAPVPQGADAVCMVEETETASDGRSVVIERELQPGAFVRQPGRDVAIGDVIAPAGTVLTPAHLGVLANQGALRVKVHPRPRVGVLSTGDELFSGTGPLPPGKIRDANRHTLLALLRREGWDGVDLGIVGDDESSLVELLSSAASSCDAIMTSGGVSVGDLDLVRVVLEKLSAGKMRWMQVAIKPAKPFAFGVLADSTTPVFGLPGNPVSAMVSFELFVRPALRRLGGHRILHRSIVSATADVDLLREPDGKLHLVRAHVSLDDPASWHVRTTSGQESHQLHSMSEANSLILLPDGTGVHAGEPVSVLLIDPDRLSPDTSLVLNAPHAQPESL
jgi:molybdenum cofactor synthesis domain-containing protein